MPRSSQKEYVIRSEGQRQLLEIDEMVSDIARRIGVDKRRLADWRSGRRTPPEDVRESFAGSYGIPVDSWSQWTPGEAPEKPGPYAGPVSTLDAVDRRLADLRRRRRRVSAESDLSKLDQTETQLLRLRAKIEHDRQTLEYRIVREHPAFARATELLLAALAPYPEAAEAVAVALDTLDAEHVETEEEPIELDEDE